VAVGRIQPLVAVTDAEDDRHVVAQHEGAGEPLDDVVESGAEAAGGEDGGMGPRGVVVDFLARPGRLKGADFAGLLEFFLHVADIFTVDDRGIFGDEFHTGQRGRDGRCTEVLD